MQTPEDWHAGAGPTKPDAADTPLPGRSTLRRIVSALLFAAAFAYLCYVVASQWSEIGHEFSQWGIATLLAALGAALAMLSFKAGYHVLQFSRLGQGSRPGALQIATAYAASQVVRYLPGKVLGIVYQSTRLAPEVPAFRVVAANLIQGIYTNLLTLCVLASILASVLTGDARVGIVLWLCGGLAVTLGHGQCAVERGTHWLARRLPHRWHRGALPVVGNGWASAIPCAALLMAEWLPYFAIWFLLAPSTASADPLTTAILLGASYAGASFAANLAVLMPSGLFVREALFLFVASQLGFDAATIIALGAVARIILTLSDILFAPIVHAVAALAGGRRP